MKRILDDIIDLISPVKRFHHNVSCLLDLPNELLLMICYYLSLYDILHCFYTPERADMRLHCLISDYYRKFNLGTISYDKYVYLINLFNDSTNPLRPESLRLSNENISCLIQHYFSCISSTTKQSMFANLINFSLIDCSTNNIKRIDNCYEDFTKLQYFHITVREYDQDNGEFKFRLKDASDISINRLLFHGRISTLHTIIIQLDQGLSLHKSLKAHQGLRHIQLFLQTIDDLFILLDGLIPNVETMTIKLCQTQILTSCHSQSKSMCPRLMDFTLFENKTKIVVNDIKSILTSMSNLHKLTLSIRDTYDPTFCNGLIIESMLTKYVSNLRRFNYTMTHRVNDKTLIEEFNRWTMNTRFYENEDIKWIHIYSLSCPSNIQDKRQLSFVNITKTDDLLEINKRFSRVHQLRSCLSIDIKLPQRISKLILSEETPVSSINSIPQVSIRHLIVERRLIDDEEISILAHQFPNVKNLELLFPLEKLLFARCFKSLLSVNDTNEKFCCWSEMINFRTRFVYGQLRSTYDDERFTYWLTRHTDLKFRSIPFYVNCDHSTISIWL